MDSSGPARAGRVGPALATGDLTSGWGSTPAIEGLTLEVPYGSRVAVLGPNGSGKSSLFAAIVGLIEPWSGSVSIGDAGLAWLPQSLELEPSFPITARDVVAMGRWARRGWLRRLRRSDHEAVDAAMAALEVSDLADRRLTTLSGGQRQRVLLAQVMAQDAGLVLLDEPLSGVDAPTAERIEGLVARWRDEGRAVMVATHDLDAAARDYDLVLALNRRQVAFGRAAEVCTPETMRRTFRGHVASLGDAEIVDTSHHHHGAA